MMEEVAMECEEEPYFDRLFDHIKNVKEEDTLKASDLFVKPLPSDIKEESTLQASDCAHSYDKLFDHIKNASKEEDTLKASSLFVKPLPSDVKEESTLRASDCAHSYDKLFDHIKNVIKEEDTLKVSHLFVKPLPSDMKEESTIQASGYSHSNGKHFGYVNDAIEEEYTLKAPRLLSLLLKPFASDMMEESTLQASGYAHSNDKPLSSDVGAVVKKESILPASDHTCSNEKFCSSEVNSVIKDELIIEDQDNEHFTGKPASRNANSDKMEVVVIDDTDDEQLEQVVSQKKSYLTEQPLLSDVKEESSLQASGYVHSNDKFSDIKNVIKEEDTLNASRLLIKLSDDVNSVIKEEDTLKVSHLLVKHFDDVSDAIEEEHTSKAPHLHSLLLKPLSSDVGAFVKEESTLQASDHTGSKEKFSDDVKNVIKEEDTLNASHLLIKPLPSDMKEESTLQASGYSHSNGKHFDDVRDAIEEEYTSKAPCILSLLLKHLSSDVGAVVKEENTLQTSDHKCSNEKPLPSDVKKESTLEASGYVHSNDKFTDDVKNVIKEEETLNASHLLVKLSDDVNSVIKEEDTFEASHLHVKPLPSDMKEESTLQASGYSHSNGKSCGDVNDTIGEEYTSKSPRLRSLLLKHLSSDVGAVVKEESTLQASDHTRSNEKSASTNANSDKMEVVVIDDTDDEEHEEIVSQKKRYRTEKHVSTNGKSDRMEMIFIDDTGYEQHEEMVSQMKRCITEKQMRSHFSLKQSPCLGNTLLNNAVTVRKSNHFSPSRASSQHVSPMELESTRFECMSPVKDENYSSVENFRQCKFDNLITPTIQELSVLNSFVEIENAFRGNVKTFYYKNQKKDCKDISSLLMYLDLAIENILYNMVILYGALKFSVIVECTYVKPVEHILQNRVFKTKYITLYYSTPLDSIVDNIIKEIYLQESTCMNLDSVWTMLCISGILLRIIQFKPLRGSSYIPLPKYLLAKKCIVNPKNKHDEYCFKWALLSRFIPWQAQRINSRYFALQNKYNFKSIDFPTPLEQIEHFEKNNNNNISINVYGIDKNKSIFPLRVCNEERPEHFDLLLLRNKSGQSHYCYIKNFQRLINSQITTGHHKIEICRRCLTHFSIKSKKLKPHKKYCGKYIPTQLILPNVNTLKFKHFHHQFRVPIVGYASFECILKSSSPSYIPSFSTRNEFRDPASFCIYFVINSDIPKDIRSKLPTEPYVYRGEHVAHKFMSYVTRIVDLIGIFMKDIKPLQMGKKDTIRFTSATHCDLCNCKFTKSVKRVRDYCHLTGKFRSVLCGTCNLQRQKQRFISIFIHTSSNYEFHFLIHKLGDNIRNIHINTDTSEKYISFTKTSSSGLFIRFIDVNHFLNNSLTPLSTEMPKDQFYHTGKFFTVHDMPLVAGKRVYPYEYISSEQTFEECSLPTKDNFFSKSSSKNIDDKEYEHAVQIWCHFNIKTLGEYSDLILKLDVLWLCDIFENIRTFCLSLYKIDCAYYFSVSDFAFNAMLKCTKIELELVTDNDMYILFEQGIRNGISWCVNSVSVANNQYIQETFDASKPIKFLPYLEVNDLYGWAMSKCMPYGGFLWRNPDDNLDILNVADDALVGFILEVDIEYPEHLYDEHRDLPFLLDNEYVSGQKHITLRTTHMSKKNYICHYVNLKQAVNHGLKITKIHRVLQFYQSPWLKTFIKLKAEKQQQARNTYEKLFIKLINRSVFEKCTENSRKQLNVKLVNNEKALQQHIIKPTFKDRIIFNESLCAVLSLNKIVNCNKPIYLGFTILELSKTLLYEFHYDVMKKNYGKNILLLYVDTDSIFYEVKTDDFYKDIMDLEFSQYFDISGNSPGHSYSSKKMLRKFKEKCRKTPVKEFIGERAKLYSIKTNNHDM